jgi:hypothetical protein
VTDVARPGGRVLFWTRPTPLIAVIKKKHRDPSGISAFIVERAFKGFVSGTLKQKWGTLAGNTGFCVFRPS